MRAQFCILATVLYLALVSSVGAQEGNPDMPELTPTVLDVGLGVEARIADIAFCHQSDCLVYIDGNNNLALIDTPHSEIIEVVSETSLPPLDNDAFYYLLISPDDRYVVIETITPRIFIWDLVIDELFELETNLPYGQMNWFYLPFPILRPTETTTKLLVPGFLSGASVLDIETRELIFHTDNPQSMYWLDDSRLMSFTDEGLVQIYDIDTDQPITTFDTKVPIQDIYVDTRHSHVYVINKHLTEERIEDYWYEVSLWDINTGKLLFTFPPIPFEAYIPRIFLSPDGLQAFIKVGNRLSIWDMNTRTLQSKFFHVDDSIGLSDPLWNSDHTRVLTDYFPFFTCYENCEYGTFVWDVHSTELLTKRTHPQGYISVWSPNPQLIVEYSFEEMYGVTTFFIWEAATGKTLHEIKTPESAATWWWGINDTGTRFYTLGEEHAYLWILPQP